MRFPFADISIWRKRSKAGITSAIIGFVALSIQANRGFPLQDTLDYMYLIVSFLPAIVGLLQFIKYATRPRRAYVIIEKGEISIFRGLFFPRKKIALQDIERYIPVSTLIILKLNGGKEYQFNTDWLSRESIREIRSILSNATENKRKYG